MTKSCRVLLLSGSLRRLSTNTAAETACVHIPVTGAMIGPTGLIADVTTRAQIVEVLRDLATKACNPP